MTDGGMLIDFVDAVTGGDEAGIVSSRRALTATIGSAGMLETAAVIGNFMMMTRIADSTGTPLDRGSVEMSTQLRDDMGLDELPTARM